MGYVISELSRENMKSCVSIIFNFWYRLERRINDYQRDSVVVAIEETEEVEEIEDLAREIHEKRVENITSNEVYNFWLKNITDYLFCGKSQKIILSTKVVEEMTKRVKSSMEKIEPESDLFDENQVAIAIREECQAFPDRLYEFYSHGVEGVLSIMETKKYSFDKGFEITDAEIFRKIFSKKELREYFQLLLDNSLNSEYAAERRYEYLLEMLPENTKGYHFEEEMQALMREKIDDENKEWREESLKNIELVLDAFEKMILNLDGGE